MNVLLITQKADRSDPVLGFTHAWFERLARRVEHLHLLVLARGEHTLPDNVSVMSMGKEAGAGRVTRLARFAAVMMRLVWTRRVDAVFVHMCPIYAVLAAPFCKLRGVALIMWITHGADNPTLRLAHRLVDKVLTASPESCALSGPRVVSTGHGIDTVQFTSVTRPEREPGPLKILSVGRVARVKDYATIIKSLAALTRGTGHPDCSLTIVGACYTAEDEVYRKELDALIAQESLGDRVTFTGGVPHRSIQDHYRNADLFVSASLTGSIDKAVLEAMASGVVTLTCNLSFQRVFGDLAAELMFGAGDQDALTQRIRQLAAMPREQRADLAACLREIVVQQHGLDTLMDRLVLEMQKSTDERTAASPRTRRIEGQVDSRQSPSPPGDHLSVSFFGVLLSLTAAALQRKSAFHHVFLEGRRVLDVACGQGQLAAHDREAYVGIDISDEMLGAVRAQGFRVVRGDATCLPFRNGGFQAVNCAQLIEHLPPALAAEMLFEAARVLEPGGVLLLRSPMPGKVWETFSHVRPYPPIAVQKLLRTQTEAYVRGRHRRALPFEIEFVLYHGPVFEWLPLRALAALWGVLLPFGRSGYAMVLRRMPDPEEPTPAQSRGRASSR